MCDLASVQVTVTDTDYFGVWNVDAEQNGVHAFPAMAAFCHAKVEVQDRMIEIGNRERKTPGKSSADILSGDAVAKNIDTRKAEKVGFVCL